MEYNEEVIRSRYQLVPRCLVFIENNNQILLIHKAKKNSFGYSKLNGIGGHIEKGEEPYGAARREIKEETGLENVEALELVAVIFIEIGINPGILLFVFKCDFSGGDLIASDEGELIWMEEKRIPSLKNTVKDLPFLLQTCADHKNGSMPVYAKYLYDENGELRIVIN